ncbi:group IIC secretory phospholipase A2 isoform X2 [Callithrix jacchus]
MVKHITGWSAFFSYYRYGCYCGLGSKGIPVDDTDRCCRAHDCCYEKPKESGRQPVLNGYSSTPSMAPWFQLWCLGHCQVNLLVAVEFRRRVASVVLGLVGLLRGGRRP